MKRNFGMYVSIWLIASSISFSQNLKALVGGTLIDGYGGQPLANSIIIIENDKIKAVGQIGSLAIPSEAAIISTEGMSIMPGLWDMHVHLMINGHADYNYWDQTYLRLQKDVIMPSSAHQLLMAGVTSARDLGAPLADILDVKKRINSGEIPGPTLYVSGPFIQHRPYPNTEPFRWGVYGVKDAQAKVNKLADAGVDCIKLIDQDLMDFEEVKAVVDQAHKRGLKVVGHAHRPDEIIIGLRAGVDNFEHTGLAAAPEYPAEVIKAIRDRTAKMNLGPLFWTPTIEGLFNYEYVVNNPEKLDNTSWHLGLPDSIISDIRYSIKHPGRLGYFQMTPLRKPTLETKFNQLRESGVVMLIGTDSGIPMKFHSQSTWNELEVWVNHFGVDPLQAIKSATYWPAVLQGVSHETGTIEAGKYADIIAVHGDVLRWINLLEDVDLVIKRGTVYKQK